MASQSTETLQPFERHPELAKWIARLASCRIEGLSLEHWQEFTNALNAAVSPAPSVSAALDHALEALTWHDGLAFEQDGMTAEQRIKAALASTKAERVDASVTKAAPAMLKAIELAVAYDDLLLKFKGPAIIFDGDVKKIDAAYDKWVAAARAALASQQVPA